MGFVPEGMSRVQDSAFTAVPLVAFPLRLASAPCSSASEARIRSNLLRTYASFVFAAMDTICPRETYTAPTKRLVAASRTANFVDPSSSIQTATTLGSIAATGASRSLK